MTHINLYDGDGKRVHQIFFSKGELEFPGYVQHVLKGYEDTKWRAVLIT